MKKIVLFIIKIYQRTLSLDHGFFSKIYGKPLCRFHPTCSEYTFEAVKRFGIFKGLFLGVKRVLRCHPWNEGGFDPVLSRDNSKPLKIFIDFDDVLFCTRDFKKDFKNIFKHVGVSNEIFDKTYQIARESNEREFGNYDYDKHVKILSERGIVDELVLSGAIVSFLTELKKYVFDDVFNFLEKAKKRGDELFLISFGSNSFQRKKIEGSGLKKYFSDIKVGNVNKALEIKKIVGENIGGEMFFIDDRIEFIEMVKKKFPKVKTILLKRVEGRYFDEVSEFCDFEASDLNEVDKVL